MKKNCRTKAQMYPLIEGFSSSGLTCKAYAKSLGMKYGTYKYWVRKYRADQKTSLEKSVVPNFIPIKVTEQELVEHHLDIVYPNGVHLRLTSSLDTITSVTLKKLVSCLD